MRIFLFLSSVFRNGLFIIRKDNRILKQIDRQRTTFRFGGTKCSSNTFEFDLHDAMFFSNLWLGLNFVLVVQSNVIDQSTKQKETNSKRSALTKKAQISSSSFLLPNKIFYLDFPMRKNDKSNDSSLWLVHYCFEHRRSFHRLFTNNEDRHAKKSRSEEKIMAEPT